MQQLLEDTSPLSGLAEAWFLPAHVHSLNNNKYLHAALIQKYSLSRLVHEIIFMEVSFLTPVAFLTWTKRVYIQQYFLRT